jgi:uncharacterized membrane protein YraQ (UPF0718 family)
MTRGTMAKWAGLAGVIFFGALSFAADFRPGREMAANFFSFAASMLWVLPWVFVLIGLFEVWVKPETVERHMGEGTGLRGHLWAVLLAGTTVGGLLVALPVAYSLHKKGAGLAVVFTYLGASAITRIPMTMFEASFLGFGFSLVRLLVSLPLVILSSMAFGAWLTKRCFRMRGEV